MDDITLLDISSSLALAAMYLLTLNILLGLLISTRYNPVRQWPHRRINIFKIHNWNAYVVLAVAFTHPILLLWADIKQRFGILDLIWPLSSPYQTTYNVLGALAFYLLLFVVATSTFRRQLGHKRWKPLHYATYALAVVFFIHGILIDPKLHNEPTDFLDG